MAGVTKEVRTIMYSVEPNGHVAVHKFPFDANDRDGMEKLQRLVKRGFTFADPSLVGSSSPQVIVTGVVELAKPIPGDEPVDEPAPEAELTPSFQHSWKEVEQSVTQTAKIEPANNGKLCSICGFVGKSEFGLSVHQRRHKRE